MTPEPPVQPGLRMQLRRGATVGVVVSALDTVVLVGLARGVGVPVPVADAVATATASAASWTLHRAITFGDDPSVRWVHQPAAYVTTAVAASAVDLAVVRALTGRARAGLAVGTGGLVAAKLVALAAAGCVRFVSYRGVLWTHTRQALGTRVDRPEPPGELRATVVVPAYGEERRVGETVTQLRAALDGIEGGVEVLVVDDGSPDATAFVAESAGARVVRLPRNRGKGAAVGAGVLAARGRTIVFTDADLAYPPSQVGVVLRAVEDGWDVVVGSRRHPSSADEAGASLLRTLSGRLFNFLTASVLLGQYRDTQCGLKGFRSDVARLLFSRTRLEGFAFDVEVLHLVERYRLSMAEIPVVLVRAPGSTVRVGLDAMRMVRDLFRVRRWARRGAYDLAPGEDVPTVAEAVPTTR